MLTIVETPEFEAAAKKLLSTQERAVLIEALARNPEAGAVMAGTGGFRKLRLAREGGGKSGGYRVIYYYYNASIPLFLFTVYAKNAQENLTKAQQNALLALSKRYQDYGRKETEHG